jgi:NAD-dependent SIR2 family protein deacetylase
MKTVFILGAGASAEIGMPTGNGLKEKIVDLFDFRYASPHNLSKKDELILKTFYQYKNKNAEQAYFLVDIAIEIAKALPLAISIDNFMDEIGRAHV